MNIMYKCQFCGKVYDWYDGLYENPKYNPNEASLALRKRENYPEKRGAHIYVNGLVLKYIKPIDDRVDGEGITAKPATLRRHYPAEGNLNVYINLCPDCMRKIIDNLKFNGDCKAWKIGEEE